MTTDEHPRAVPGPVPAQPVTVPGAGLTVRCPRCGTLCVVDPAHRSASGFCPSCDYPVFWASTPDVRGPATARSYDALRRAPGTGGAAERTGRPCPVCSEPNELDAFVCVRCGSLMDPPPPAPAPLPPLPAPSVIVQEVVVQCGHLPQWLVVVSTAVVTVAATLTVILLL